jgi:hypothetical protein
MAKRLVILLVSCWLMPKNSLQPSETARFSACFGPFFSDALAQRENRFQRRDSPPRMPRTKERTTIEPT